MKNTIFLLLAVTLLAPVAFAQAQPSAPAAAPNSAPLRFAPDTIVPAELSKSLDAKKLKAGDPIEAKTTVDMLSNGQIIMARNTKVVGHVTSVKAHSKESPDSTLAIAFDRFVLKDGHELPLQASVQAIGPPINAFAASSPAGGSPDAPISPIGAGSSPGGGSTGGGQRSGGGGGTSSQPSYPTTGMPSGSSNPSHSSPGGALSSSSQGVVGIKDLSLAASPQASVFSSSTKNVHLDGGSQLILRVQ
jgi:hypothetical protein